MILAVALGACAEAPSPRDAHPHARVHVLSDYATFCGWMSSRYILLQWDVPEGVDRDIAAAEVERFLLGAPDALAAGDGLQALRSDVELRTAWASYLALLWKIEFPMWVSESHVEQARKVADLLVIIRALPRRDRRALSPEERSEAARRLEEVLRDVQTDDLRGAAILEIDRLGPEAIFALSGLAHVVRSQSRAEVRIRAAAVIARLGAAARAAIPDLEATLDAPDHDHYPYSARAEVAGALASVGGDTARALRALMDGLALPGILRRSSMEWLGKLGVTAMPAVPELLKIAAEARDEETRDLATGAVLRIAGDLASAVRLRLEAAVRAVFR